jgi:hypothetical protein
MGMSVPRDRRLWAVPSDAKEEGSETPFSSSLKSKEKLIVNPIRGSLDMFIISLLFSEVPTEQTIGLPLSSIEVFIVSLDGSVRKGK